MEIILKQDIENLGYAGDIVKVKSGYARNYLLPQKMAILATESNKKVVAENKRQAAHKIEKELQAARDKAAQLSKTEVKMPVRVGTTGKLFGSITTLQISRVLKDMGFEVDRKDITFLEEVKELGKYKISVKVFKDISATLHLNVFREEESE